VFAPRIHHSPEWDAKTARSTLSSPHRRFGGQPHGMPLDNGRTGRVDIETAFDKFAMVLDGEAVIDLTGAQKGLGRPCCTLCSFPRPSPHAHVRFVRMPVAKDLELLNETSSAIQRQQAVRQAFQEMDGKGSRTGRMTKQQCVALVGLIIQFSSRLVGGVAY
jgi:hypothetical protein